MSKIGNKKIKMKINKLWSWAFPSKDEEYLTQKDIESLGFKETLTKGHFVYFKKGNMSLKWDFHVEHRVVSLRWGKSMRFFGNVETKEELKQVLNKIDKYFG